MSLYGMKIEPASSVPLPGAKTTRLNLHEQAAAAARTVDLLVENGLELEVLDSDAEATAQVLKEVAETPGNEPRALTEKRMAQMTPTALKAIDYQLKQFSHQVVEDAQQVRTYVTNKLLEESDNPDPRIRMRALELLGKIGDVGLFVERTEHKVTHGTTDELRDALRAKLTKLVNPDDPKIIDAEVVPAPREQVAPEDVEIDVFSSWDD